MVEYVDKVLRFCMRVIERLKLKINVLYGYSIYLVDIGWFIFSLN